MCLLVLSGSLHDGEVQILGTLLSQYQTGSHFRRIMQLRKRGSENAEFKIPFHFASNTGYIILQVVVFYTNYLAKTPTTHFQGSEAIHYVHGLASLNHWAESEAMHRRIHKIPTIVVLYEQCRLSRSATEHKSNTKKREAPLHDPIPIGFRPLSPKCV
ncbi:Hypothetical protein PHPALM_16809 [Phytophthora palmivora]|uniref:Uncharacterized protein n=1 Tax=Phytophthora palmivora TaxID=4796 RepID=A0A2P4XNW7_9STRA|nr:Hypothetical protein PHPALM_16809 [Phytophthora palmivora]